MSDYVCNAVIESAEISSGERGILECWLTVNYDGSGQGFGGYGLYLPKSYAHHAIEGIAGHYIYRCMEIAGVDAWKRMPGRTLRVRKDSEWGSIKAIGHIIKDDWFDPSVDFAYIAERNKA